MTGPSGLPVPGHDWAWFLDLDGTLVHLTRSPRGVRVDQAVRRLVAMLHHDSGGAVALISGRPIAELDRLFGHGGFPAAGQHGVERRGASGRIRVHRGTSARLDRVRRRLAAAVAWHPRVLLEDKGLSVALHYRGAPALAAYVHRLVRAEAASLGRAYSLQAGKRVIEIHPAGRDKGKAVKEFMRERPFRGRLPVFIGDDRTDEFAFAVVNGLGGYSVKVGRGATVASWRLRDVAAVRSWLARGRPAPRPA